MVTEADEPGHLLGLKMALRDVLHHLFQFGKGIGFRKDVVPECSGGITPFCSFLYQEDYLLFHISLLSGVQFFGPSLDPADHQ